MATGHQLAKRSSASVAHAHSRPPRSQVPAFLQKLYEMLNDPNNYHLIRWSEAGDSFIVPNHEQFAREVLGRWFKHQNFHSFVRQLNMYGFHKIPQLQQGVLKSDSDVEIWNFAHPHFRRGEPHLLNYIQRKRQAQGTQGDIAMDGAAAGAGVIGTIDFHDATGGANGAGTPAAGQVLDVQSIVNGISAIKRHQSTIQADLAELKQSNQLLWQDAMDVRTKYQKQQDTINRIVKFLAGVFGTRAGSHKDDEVEAPNSQVVIPRRRTRLMIEDGRSKKVGVMDAHDKEHMEDQILVPDLIQESYSSVETPVSVPSPAPSDNITPSIVETSMHFGSYNTPSEPPTQPPTLPANREHQPPSYLDSTQPTQASQPQSQPQPSQPSDHALTSSRPPNSPQALDIQQVLNQLTPQQLAQLFSLSFPPLDGSLPDNHGPPPPSASSQLTSYQPSPFDFSHLMPAHRDEHDQDLISFDPSLDKQWKVTDDLDKEVNMLGSSIHSFMQEMQDLGLDPQQLDGSGSVLLPPILESTNQDPHLGPPTPAPNLHLPDPISNPPSATDDFDDMYRFLNLGRDSGPESEGASADMDDGSLSTAFLDEVQAPPESPMTPAPPVGSKKSGGNKRKSDVLGEVLTQVPAPAPERIAVEQPPKRGGVKMNMDAPRVTTRSTKRRKADK